MSAYRQGRITLAAAALATVLGSLGTAEANSYYWGARHFEYRYGPPRYVPPSTRRPKVRKPVASAPYRSKVSKRRGAPAATADRKPAALPAGPLHVIVSIRAQRASLFAGGTLVEQASISTGTPAYPTPMGVFSILQKNRHHISNIYHVPMPFMQRITWSGIALHQGPLPGYPASHGCIRLPQQFAEFLWRTTKLGARVIVTRDEVAPIDIAHPRLLTPKPKDLTSQASAPGLMVKTADGSALPGAVMADADPPSTGTVPPSPVTAPPLSAKELERRNAPVSVFVSRKDGKLYVRQATVPLFDAPVTIRDSDRPMGTHVFTAMALDNDAMRWTVVSIPSAYARGSQSEQGDRSERRRRNRAVNAAPVADPSLPGAGDALDRIEMPREAIDRIAELLTPGSSLIISDNGISGETGRGTDFIVLTR